MSEVRLEFGGRVGRDCWIAGIGTLAERVVVEEGERRAEKREELEVLEMVESR